MKQQPEIKLPSFTPSAGAESLTVEQFLANPNAVILDIRTIAEYEVGHIEGAESFPLFSNEERSVVGKIYKQQGKDLAVEQGLAFVGPKLAHFVKSAKKFGKSKQFYLYCWRGGMRSRSMAWLLSTAGLKVSLLNGGYKAFRQEFVSYVEKPWRFVTLLGPTGVGKTELLYELISKGEQVLDLEGLANHKGSAFGGLGMKHQPTTEEFINRIHIQLRNFDSTRPVWVEGESIMIGSCFIPKELYDLLLVSPYYRVDMCKEERVARLTAEYGSQDSEQVLVAFEKITKRMGYDKTKEAIESFKQGDVRRAVELALDYYDKGYAMASEKRVGEDLGGVVLKNHNHQEVAQWLIDSYRKIEAAKEQK